MLADETRWIYRRIERYWWLALPLVAIAWVFVQAAPAIEQIGVSEDSALFYYSGRQWIQAGRIPYLHLWDIKPPLTHQTTALIALVTGGESHLMNAVGIALNIGSIAGGISVSMIAVRNLTDSRVAGAVVGVTCLAFPYLFEITLTGFRPKYPVVLFLGITLLAGTHQRWVTATAAATIAAGFWQPPALVLLIVLTTIAWYRYRGRITPGTSKRASIAVVGITVAAVLPVIVGGALPEMIVQTIVAPVVTGDGGGDIETVLDLTHPILAVIAAVGVFGLADRSNHPIRWWPGLFLVAFGLVALTGDLDGSADLLPLSLLIAVGVGVAFGIAKPVGSPPGLLTNPRFWLLLVIAVSVLFAPPLRFPTIEGGPVYELFSSETVKAQCHIMLSEPEEQMLNILGTRFDVPTCWRPSWWVF